MEVSAYKVDIEILSQLQIEAIANSLFFSMKFARDALLRGSAEEHWHSYKCDLHFYAHTQQECIVRHDSRSPTLAAQSVTTRRHKTSS